MCFNFANLRKLRQERDQRILAVARKVDPDDRTAIDLYAQELAGDICRAALRDIAENYRRMEAARGTEIDVTFLAEEALPTAAYYRECVHDIKKVLYQALRAIGKITPHDSRYP